MEIKDILFFVFCYKLKNFYFNFFIFKDYFHIYRNRRNIIISSLIIIIIGLITLYGFWPVQGPSAILIYSVPCFFNSLFLISCSICSIFSSCLSFTLSSSFDWSFLLRTLTTRFFFQKQVVSLLPNPLFIGGSFLPFSSALTLLLNEIGYQRDLPQGCSGNRDSPLGDEDRIEQKRLWPVFVG